MNEPMPTMRGESDVALATNVAAFDQMAEERLINGSPHLKHQSLRRLHRELISRAADGPARPSGEIEVLELGAGDGLGSIHWFEMGVRHIVAVDPSAAMLKRYAARAATYGLKVEVASADADGFLQATQLQFDVVSFASVLHHIPDYLASVRAAIHVLRPGGSLVTFQDPLRYDAMPRLHHLADRAAYLSWRTTQGELQRGLRTLLRRLRGVYSANEPSDYEEYHVVRNGVDSAAIVAALAPGFQRVREARYWSTPSTLWQAVGERLRFHTEFGIVATGFRGRGN